MTRGDRSGRSRRHRGLSCAGCRRSCRRHLPARDDGAVLVEVAVDARGVEPRSGCFSSISAMPRRRHQHQRAHVGAALAASAHCPRWRPSRPPVASIGSMINAMRSSSWPTNSEVGHRLQGLLVTRDADHADLGARHHVEHAVEHAQPALGWSTTVTFLPLICSISTGPAQPRISTVSSRKSWHALVNQQAGDLGKPRGTLC